MSMASKYGTGVSGGFRQAGKNVALSRALLSVGTLQRGAALAALCVISASQSAKPHCLEIIFFAVHNGSGYGGKPICLLQGQSRKAALSFVRIAEPFMR